MNKSRIVFCIILHFCCLSLQAQVKKTQAIKYAVIYQEEISAAYGSMLQKPQSSDFKKHKSNWEGSIYVDAIQEERTSARIRINKTQTPADPSNPAGVYYTVNLLAEKDRGIQRICYPIYPPRETDVVVKNIFTAIQFFSWESRPPRRYETYADGRFSVVYQTMKSDDQHNQQTVVQKTKLSSRQPGNEQSYVIIDSFVCLLRFNQNSHLLESAEIYEYKHQKIAGQTLAYISSSIKIFKQTPDENASTGSIELVPDSNCFPVLSNLTREERKQRISRSALKNTSIKELISELRNGVFNEAQKEFDMTSRLKAALHLYPESFQNMRQLLGSLQASDKRYQVLFNAFLGSENLFAQQYLAEILKNNTHDYSILRSLLPQIGIMTYVVDSSLLYAITNLLYASDESISSLSGLTLSNISRQYKYNDSARHRQVNNLLFTHYFNGPKNHRTLLQYLKQLGNSGDETKTDFLSEQFNASDHEISLEAINAARFILNTRMDSLLSQQMVRRMKDSIFSERLYEVVSLRFPAKVLRESIYRFLKESDDSWPTRNKYLGYLLKYADEIPTLHQEVAGLSFNDATSSALLAEIKNTAPWYHEVITPRPPAPAPVP